MVKSTDERKKYVEALLGSIGVNPRIESLQLTDISNRDTPLSISSKTRFANWATVSGDLLLFKARPDQASPAFASPFVEDSRLYPIYQSEPRLMRANLEVTIPEGYSYLYIPKAIAGESALGRFSRTVQQDGRKLTISIEVQDQRASVPATEYPALRQYIERYLRMYGELVIARKDVAVQVIK